MSNVLLGIITILLSAFGGLYITDRSITAESINTNTSVIRDFVDRNSTEHRLLEDKLGEVETNIVSVEIWTQYNDKRITKLEHSNE